MTTDSTVKQSLELYFEDCAPKADDGPIRISLHKVLFFHPLLDRALTSVRGNSADAQHASGTFHWSQGVRALSLLLLSASRDALTAPAESSGASLSGYAGSVASSLDYALGKQPNWLLDMFGVDQRGTALARRLIRRSNPERRRPGPVTLSLNSHFLAAKHIKVFRGTKQLERGEDFDAALRAIDPAYSSDGSQGIASTQLLHVASTSSAADAVMSSQPNDLPPAPFDRPQIRRALKDVFRKELSTSLRNTTIFRRGGLGAVQASIRNQPFLAPLLKRLDRIVENVDGSLTASERMGIVSDPGSLVQQAAEGAPLSLFVPCLHPSSIGIFQFLKQFRKLPIDIQSGHQHSTHVALRLLNRDYHTPPALAVMNVATALHVLANQKKDAYYPLMLLPGLTQRLVGPKGSKPSSATSRSPLRQFHFMHEIPTLASLYFSELVRKRAVVQKRARIEETEPCDVGEVLTSDDIDQRAILPCPVYDLHRIFNGAVLLDDPDPLDISNFSILLVSKELFQDQERCRTLDILIRDAWLSLLGKQEQLESVLDSMVADSNFLSTLRRTSGLHLLNPDITVREPRTTLSSDAGIEERLGVECEAA